MVNDTLCDIPPIIDNDDENNNNNDQGKKDEGSDKLGDVIIKDPLDKEINIFSGGNLTFYHNEATQSLQFGKSSDVKVHITINVKKAKFDI